MINVTLRVCSSEKDRLTWTNLANLFFSHCSTQLLCASICSGQRHVLKSWELLSIL